MTLPFRYVRPSSLAEALELLAASGPGARPMAGGTDLLVAIRRGAAAPETVVDLTGIPELATLEVEEDVIRVGACVTHARLASSPLVRERIPLLAHAARAVGSAQIRNLGTVGGNVANASVAADTLPALAALDAEVVVAGPQGRRRIPLADFVRGPGDTALGAGELLAALLIPMPAPHGAAFEKVGRRRAVSIARLSVAVAAAPGRGWARISIGGVFPTPRRLPEAESALANGFGPEACREAGGAAQKAVAAVSGERPSMAYKLPVVGRLVAHTARVAVARAGGGGG